MKQVQKPRAFRSRAAFRAWLEANHDAVPELVIRCCKLAHRHRGVTYREALDEALCFGWIDGVRHAFDEATFTVRFTPRKARSNWSEVNIRRAKELCAEGRMRPAGLAAFARRPPAGPARESPPGELDASLARRLRRNGKAWRFFLAQPAWYRRTCSRWIRDAKRPETRARRLAVLVAHCEAGEPIPPLRRGPGSSKSP